ncbi:conserved hypothetical protein [Sporisorium reilianum SRZ2]|uniref:CCHC-type domain-containing protein n=1 Tax=Sporisorium reilianum (strain SRZ2) TaxID=999809 RepID=E6ZUN4_SPORE|nr:conserved hypothetical protein [Sporisorium reilianum SRZ2]
MTRYTKLEGRRSLAKKTIDSDSEPESTPAASPAKLEVQEPVSEIAPETPSKDKKKKEKKDKKDKKSKKDNTEETADISEPKDEASTTEPVASTSAIPTPADTSDATDAAPSTTPAADAEPPTVEKLLKRAKLLKLKAKKAKNEESKKRFQRMTRDVERQVEQMFGSFEYGPKGQLIRLGAPQSDTMWQSRHKGADWSASSAGAPMGGDGGWGARGGHSHNAGAYSHNGSHSNSNGAGWGQTDDQRRMDHRDARREERAEQRQAKLKCFACRGMGHSAKDCPNALDAQSISLKTDTASSTDTPMIGRDAVGICFRCGSTEHTLSKCRKPTLKNDALPYATCFICHAKGHLSSKCPNNAGRGVYPEGGSCKLCSSVEHLAKDCPLSLRNEGKTHKMDRDAKSLVNQVIVGSTTGGAASGGDEDDFHSFARKRAQVDHEAKASPAKRIKKDAKVVSF